ncbi:transmembrane protein 6/97 [Mucidula mucida]|nr:transmembrane protein 6/97 [Mucidula mucida]
MSRVPLASRPLDLVYFTFFLWHLVASFAVDFQALFYPYTWLPSIPEYYISFSNDPLIGGAMRKEHNLTWFICFLAIEFLFQLPVFVLGMIALWKDSKSIYVLLLVYASSTVTTTLPCLVHVVQHDGLSTAQRTIILSGYVPFSLVPLGMAVDMGYRITNSFTKSSLKND